MKIDTSGTIIDEISVKNDFSYYFFVRKYEYFSLKIIQTILVDPELIDFILYYIYYYIQIKH